MMKKTSIVFSGIVFLSCFSSVQAASLVLASQGGWNGFAMSASVRSGFRQAGMAGGLEMALSSDSGMAFIVPDVIGAGDTVMVTSTTSGTSPLSVSATPDSGAAKDVAQGTVSASYTVGSASSDDSFTFDINTLTSAELAQVDFGSGLENADAFFEATITLITFSPATIPGAVIQLPGLPTLTGPVPSVETLDASYSSFIGGVPVSQNFMAGDSGELVALDLTGVAEFFEYTLNYTIVTPYGTDPVTSYSINGGAATTIPEPGTALLLSALALVFSRRRRS